MAMAKKHVEGGRVITSGKLRASRNPTKVSSIQPGSASQKSTPNKKGEPHLQRLTPVRVQSLSPQGNIGCSPRTSPGLLAGHYAGCKFSEPPLPSALPLPPQHWMQATRSVRLPFHPPMSDHNDVAKQLKVLLKVQA